MPKPVRVVVLGGGMGGLTAAWRLASQPGGAYEVRVFEKDWRLGGKGASGRSQAPGFGNRVEEHGLHILMGFYENAFHVLKQCYDKVARSPDADKILSWDKAFTPWDTAMMADRRRNGTWGLWRLWLPPNGKRIGGPPRPSGFDSLFHEGWDWLHQFERDFHEALKEELPRPPRRLVAKLAARLHRLVAGSPFGRHRWLLPLQRLLLQPVHRALHDLHERSWDLARRHGLLDEPPGGWPGLEEGEGLQAIDWPRRLLIAIWFGSANLIGMIRDGIVLPPHDFSCINDVDYRDWLENQLPIKPPPDLGRQSPPVNALYDLAFSNDRTLAAGTSLWVVLRMFLDYKGHVAYRMNGGMGDVVFAPMYYALNQCDRASVEFFTEVVHIEPNAKGDAIEKIVLRRRFQTPKDWNPLTPVRIPGKGAQFCWPNKPLGRLDPSNAEIVLEAGKDFEVAVLGIPVAELPSLFPSLGAKNPRFATMMKEVRTVATQAIQLWLGPTLEKVGWKHGSAMLISFTRPFNSGADMFQVLPFEPWPSPAPKTLAYFADALEDSDYAEKDPTQVVKDNARRFIEKDLPQIWPGLTWSDLHDPRNGSGPARLSSQYVRANVVPSERYTLAEAGAHKHRLPAGDSGFHNLALAGDWVQTMLSAGALEGAAMGGLDAARAILEGKVHA